MISKLLRYSFLFVLGLRLLAFDVNAQHTFEEKHLEVSLRMIGHQLLLKAGDSTSRVLPIIKTDNQYKIEFESDFGFQPDELVTLVREIMSGTGFTKRYIVEVEHCESKEVVYSFEIDSLFQQEIIPCSTREQPKQCFSLVFSQQYLH